MDIKSAAEAVGIIARLKEIKDQFTGNAEIKGLRAQLTAKEQQLEALYVPGLSSQDLAVIGISAITIVAIIAILVIVAKYQPGVIQA